MLINVVLIEGFLCSLWYHFICPQTLMSLPLFSGLWLCRLFLDPIGNCLPRTELLQSPFRTEFSMGSLRHYHWFLWCYRWSMRWWEIVEWVWLLLIINHTHWSLSIVVRLTKNTLLNTCKTAWNICETLWTTSKTSWNTHTTLWNIIKHSNTRHSMQQYQRSMWQHQHSAFQYRRSIRRYRRSAWQYRRCLAQQYRCPARSSGDIGDCSAGITPTPRYVTVTNPWDMGIFFRHVSLGGWF